MTLQLVSMTASAVSTRCRDAQAAAIVERIRDGRWFPQVEALRATYTSVLNEGRDAKKAAADLKRSLPGVLWSGRFSRRAGDALLAHSGLLCADLDDLGPRLPEVRAALSVSPHLWALFTSPTGTGLKAVFRVEANAAQHAASFLAVQQHVNALAGVEIDAACRDVARLCFVSHDPDAYLNVNARPLVAPPVTPKTPAPSVPINLTTRQRIAADLLGAVHWTSETAGFVTCPGLHLHTNTNGPRDCELHLDGAPTIHCFHNSCREAVEQANRELRSRIGKAEFPTTMKNHIPTSVAAEYFAPDTGSSDDQAFTRLAALSPTEYDRVREAEAKNLSIRTATLDAEVARRRATPGAAQGTAVELADAEPWPEPVNGAELLGAVADTISRYVSLPPGAADALALWTPHTHAFEAFLHTPRLNLHSPEKGCGKTTLLDVLAALVPRALRTENITPAVLFRLVEQHKPTLLLDEVDTYLGESDELRGLLNAGHKRGAKAYRCEGDRNEVRAFAAFAPAALAGIGNLPGTLHDRSIMIRLIRAKPGEVAARFDSRRTAAESELCRKLARWASDHQHTLEQSDPALPAGAFNRLADNWRPLFAIAAAAGGDWPARAATAFQALTAHDDLEAHGIGTVLLGDIRAQFEAAHTDRLPSADMVEALHRIEGRPWAEYGKLRLPISTNQLAALLRRFSVSSRAIRVGEHTPRGYLRADLADAFERYLPPSPVSGCNSATTPVNIGDSPLFEPQQSSAPLQMPTAIPANDDGACCTVALEKPHSGGEPDPEVLHV